VHDRAVTVTVTMLSVGHTTLSVGHTTLSVGHTTLSVGHTTLSVGHTTLSVGHTTLSMPVSKCSILVKSILQCFVLDLEMSVGKTAFIFKSSHFRTSEHRIRSNGGM
jgi:hypothetical protein